MCGWTQGVRHEELRPGEPLPRLPGVRAILGVPAESGAVSSDLACWEFVPEGVSGE